MQDLRSGADIGFFDEFGCKDCLTQCPGVDVVSFTAFLDHGPAFFMGAVGKYVPEQQIANKHLTHI